MLDQMANLMASVGALSSEKLEEDVKVWDVSVIIPWQDIKASRRQLEEKLKKFLLEEEAPIRAFCKPEDFLVFLVSSVSDESFFFAHSVKARIDEYLKASKVFQGERVDLGPMEIVYEKLKEGADKANPKYHSVLDLPPS